VIRGGAWINHVAGQVRAALRYWYAPQSHSSYVGFRCAQGADPKALRRALRRIEELLDK
jgi:hypothetical protein